MAFVPKVHNREVPVANHPVAARSQQESHGRHLRSLHEMSPRVETRWGSTWNGVREQKQPAYTHVRSNLKRAQIQDERFAEIELENTVLLAKLSKILRRSRNPTLGTRDWTGGLRLTPNQVPVIDHWISQDTTKFGAAVEPSSLNLSRRRQERERIEVENRALVARLQSCKPTYDKGKFEQDARGRERWLASHAMPRPLSPIPTGSRPGSGVDPMASATGSLLSVGSSGSQGRGGSKLRPLRKGGRVSSGVDSAVLSVLDLLSSHMRGASSSLTEMRVARDSLMESVYPVTEAYHVDIINAGGVESELVCSKATLDAYVASAEPKLLVIVHGGMFVTGSARAGRHLAARLSDLLGIPVVTPTLRLAPEHPYPAALDDLRAAYSALTSSPVGGAKVKPSQVAVFAESSGGSLLLGMLNRSAAGSSEVEPAAVVLASPWLDMSCSSSSYMTNEGRDPVMQRKRLLGIARAYLPPEMSPSDPLVSPILGNAPSLLGLPPTLVQVGSAEVLVDETLEFERLSKSVDADVAVQLYDGVLHAWHTFFPLMPKAVAALDQAAAFFAKHLGLQLPMMESMPMAAAPMAASSVSDAEFEAAAVKLQAIQRGRMDRKKVASKPKPLVSQPTTVKWTVDYDRDQELAAIKMQAMQRGRKSRKSTAKAALTYGASDNAESKALKKRKTAIADYKIGYCEAHGRGAAMENFSELTEEQQVEVAENMAATRVQALVRGKNGRKKIEQKKADGLEAGWNAGSGRAGFVSGDDRSKSMKHVGNMSDEDAAAAKMQGLARARAARKERAALMAEREEAATKLAAARRGQLARKQVGGTMAEQKASEEDAATKLQTSMRGKVARKEREQTMAERKAAATKMQSARRGQQARAQVADMKVTGTAVPVG